jgi:PAS domain-containing protein
VLAIDRDGAIIFANEPFTQMLGYPTETVTTMKFDEIFSSMAATPSAVSAVHVPRANSQAEACRRLHSESQDE